MNYRIFLFLLILLAIDLYVFQGVRFLIQSRTVVFQKIVTIAYWSVAALCFGIILSGNFIEWHTWPKMIRTYAFAIIVIVYFSKLLTLSFLLIDDVVRGLRWAGNSIIDVFKAKADTAIATTPTPTNGISRLDFIVKLGFVVGSIPFFSMLYGMIGTAYDYRVRKVKMNFPKLPEAFDGMKVIQISDLHTGSFMGTNHLEKAVDIILKQKPDVIFFTGDLVNDLHTEALEFTDTLKKLQAPLGVYSILGNHDYGDYYQWQSADAKHENLEKLKNFQRNLGWNLLLNEHHFIEKDGHRIGLVGVENWSKRLNFKKYGDMKQATHQMEPADFNILLSHDPSHWRGEILNEYKYIDLTLSGHTHGMQFGVEIPGFKWSPVQYFYKEWADLYAENNQYLYVNRGLGFLGYPGRVGILPEITLFEFNRSTT